MPRHNTLHQGQTHTTSLATAGVAAPVKLLKDPRQVVWCDARPCICHLDDQGATVLESAHLDRIAGTRELQGVIHQVIEGQA